MSARIPPIAPSDLTPEQRTAHDYCRNAVGRFDGVFTTSRPDGALLGPWSLLLETPNLIQPHRQFISAIQALPLKPSIREVVIIATGSKYKAPYELYAHKAVGIKQAGLSEAQADAIAEGKKPADLTEEQGVAFDMAIALTHGTGKLADEIWEKGVKLLGRTEALAVVHFVGIYCYTCVVLNAGDIAVPAS